MTLYKTLNTDGTPCHGGTGKWSLPRGKRPGAWMPEMWNIVLCERGYHILKPSMLLSWAGPALFEAELHPDATTMWDADKGVTSCCRLVRRVETWNDRTLRLFACDCAERALKLVQNPDPCSVAAIEVARRFADGKAIEKELAAAWAAEQKWQQACLQKYLRGQL